MKTLKQIVTKANLGGYSPKPENERRGVEALTVQKTADANGNGDDVFQATNVKTINRSTERHGHDAGEDEKAYKKVTESFAFFVMEKTLTPAELKKREEIARAIERENPGIDKSKKMAIATAQAKKVAEEVEQIDEISKKTLGSYIQKAARDMADDANASGYSAGSRKKKSIYSYNDSEQSAREQKREKGIATAVKKLTKEDVDQIDEKLTDDAKEKIQSALGTKADGNTLRQTSGPAKALISIAKTKPSNTKKGTGVDRAGVADSIPLNPTVQEEVDTTLLEFFLTLNEDEQQYVNEMLDEGRIQELTDILKESGE